MKFGIINDSIVNDTILRAQGENRTRTSVRTLVSKTSVATVTPLKHTPVAPGGGTL